jgi:ABC-type transport system substrate-binding protein
MNIPPAALDPHRWTSAAQDVILGMVYSRLVQLAPNWNSFEPDLAENWNISPDGKAYTFTLRSNTKFHDGSTLSAEDVVFSFSRIMDPKTNALLRSMIADVFDRVEAVDARTVRIVLKRRYAPLLAVLALPTAAIVSKDWVTRGGNLALTLMGTGPMRFVSMESNVKITLTRHTQYYESGLPHLDGISCIFITDETARSTALRNGSVDFVDYLPYKDRDILQADPNVRIYSDSVAAGVWAMANVKRPPLDNPMVRQAINWAINRDAVLKAAFFGHGAAMDTVFMPKTLWAYSPETPKYGYDPDRARSLIAKSGVRMPADLEILSASIAAYGPPSQVLQANLLDLGFRVKLELPDFAQQLKRFFASDYQVGIWGGGPTFADPDFLSVFFDSTGAVGRTTGYANRTLEGFLQEARTSLTQNRRKALYLQAYKILVDDAPWFPLVYRAQAEASASYVQGYNRVLGNAWNGIRIAKTWISK